MHHFNNTFLLFNNMEAENSRKEKIAFQYLSH